MATNRFDSFSPIRLESNYHSANEIPTMNFDLWAKALGKQQDEYNQLTATRGLIPKYASFDRESADKWTKENEAKIKSITDIFASGQQNALNLGNRALQEHLSNLRQDMTSGNFALMAQRKAQHEEAMKQIETGTKDDPALARDYSLALYQKGIKPNELTQSLTAPSTGKYQDIEKQLYEAKKVMESDKIGKIQIGERFIEKTTTESYSPQKIKEVFDAIIGDAKNKFTIDANAWSKSRNINPEEYAQRLNAQSKKQVEAFESQMKNVDKILSSGNEKDIKQLQQLLIDNGIDVGKVDGKAGNLTKEGVSELKEMLSSKRKEIETNPITGDKLNLTEIAKSEYIGQQRKMFSSLFGYKETKDLDVNQYGLESVKQSNRMKVQDHIYKLKEMSLPPPQEGIVNPDNPTQNNFDFGKQLEQAKQSSNGLSQSVSKGKNTLFNYLGIPTGGDEQKQQQVFADLMRMKTESTDSRGNVDPVKLKAKLAQNGSWWTSTFNADKVANLFNSGDDNSGKIKSQVLEASSAYEAKKAADWTINNLNNAWGSVAEQSMQNGDVKKAWEKEYNKNNRGFKTLDEFISNTLANQGTVNKTNPFYYEKRKGQGNTLEISEHNSANEIIANVNKATKGALDKTISKTNPTYRYVQNQKDMPTQILLSQIDNDLARGAFKGYGLTGDAGLKWKKLNGEVVDITDPKKMSDTKSSIVMTPSGATIKMISTVDGQQVVAYSDIREELKPTAAKSMYAEAFQVQSTNPNLASQLSNSARLLEDGYSSYPDVKYRNNTTNSTNTQIRVVGANKDEYFVTDRISNDFIGKPVTINGIKFGLKRIGQGDESVLAGEFFNEQTGKKETFIQKRSNGKMSSSKSYKGTDDEIYKELNLFNLNSRPDIIQAVEVNKKQRSVNAPQQEAPQIINED